MGPLRRGGQARAGLTERSQTDESMGMRMGISPAQKQARHLLSLCIDLETSPSW